VLGTVRGAPLAAETVRRIVAVTGAAVAAHYAAEAQAACCPRARAPAPLAAPAAVEIILDGAWIRSRDNAHGMEVKVGVVQTGSEACGVTRTRLPVRQSAATAQGVAAFGPLVTAALDTLFRLCQRGADAAGGWGGLDLAAGGGGRPGRDSGAGSLALTRRAPPGDAGSAARQGGPRPVERPPRGRFGCRGRADRPARAGGDAAAVSASGPAGVRHRAPSGQHVQPCGADTELRGTAGGGADDWQWGG
jgi:hypothetical protein